MNERKANASLRSLARPALVSAVFFLLLTGLAYPLAVTGLANVLFPHQAHGSLIERDGRIVGSEVLGQAFVGPGYFHPRPSQTGESPYNAAASGASNLGPTSRALVDEVGQRVLAYRHENGLADEVRVPVDAVTSSASGLDPDISLANARMQAARVARARHLDAARVLALIEAEATPRQLGVLGEPRVNVLRLNSALDRLATPRTGSPSRVSP